EELRRPFGSTRVSEPGRLGVLAPDLPEGGGHLADGGLDPGRAAPPGDERVVGAGRRLQGVEGGLDLALVAGGPAAGQLGPLLALDLGRDAQDLQGLRVARGGPVWRERRLLAL